MAAIQNRKQCPREFENTAAGERRACSDDLSLAGTPGRVDCGCCAIWQKLPFTAGLHFDLRDTDRCIDYNANTHAQKTSKVS